MDHAVIANDVSRDDRSGVYLDRAVLHGHGHLLAIYGRNLLAVKGDNSRSKNSAAHDVVCENGAEKKTASDHDDDMY